MPLFALNCTDKPGALALRTATREAHLAHLRGLGDAVRLAGPLADAAGGVCGSLIVIEAEDLAAAQALSEADPYAQAGLFERVDVREFRATFGNL